jgi:hypothetical protein
VVSNVARRVVIRTYKFETAEKNFRRYAFSSLGTPRHPFAHPSLRRTAVLCGMVELLESNELEMVWKDAAAAGFQILPAKLPVG